MGRYRRRVPTFEPTNIASIPGIANLLGTESMQIGPLDRHLGSSRTSVEQADRDPTINEWPRPHFGFANLRHTLSGPAKGILVDVDHLVIH